MACVLGGIKCHDIRLLRVRFARIPYRRKRAMGEEELVEPHHCRGIEHEQRAGRARDTMKNRNFVAQADDGDDPAEDLKSSDKRIESRTGREHDRRTQQKNQ